MAARCIYGEKSFGACDSATGGLGIGKSEADIKKNKRNKEEKRTMKKLTVLLAAVMAFAFSATAYAATPSDLADQPVKVQDAFAKTMALGIINGYEDGTAGPTQNITRAEFAKIAVTAAGAKDTADMLANNASSFKDIKAGQWYTGWINAAESLGIFQGDGNGNFRPNDTITNQEVITVLMRLLGYNDNLNGTWPVNYVTEANKKEILDDVAVVAAAPATRADVVVMLDATLDAYLVTYDKDTNEFVLKQNTKSGSKEIALLEDSFKGKYVEDVTFAPVTDVRDFDKQTLNWEVGKGYNGNMIIDGETRVSYNGGSLFDLEGHAGKVYYVKDSDKYYVRYIEVESYTKTVTDKPENDANNGKVVVNKTKYTAADKLDFLSGKTDKNSNYILYFNDDDQVYAVKSDKDFDEKTAYVKTINSSTMKLVGSDYNNKSVSLDDVLVYTEDGFIAAADLTVGDAVMEIADDLFVKVDDVTATLTKKSGEKYTIGGKSYVYAGSKLLDKEFDAADATVEDVYGNEVSYILNKDNSLSAVIVDETSTGTKLYGIVVGGDNNQNGFGNNTTSKTVSIFTAEGKTVTYEYDLDDNEEKFNEDDLGKLVEYKLTKDGDIKSTVRANDTKSDKGSFTPGEIEVKNSSYLKTDSETLTLASNVVIFEVDSDDDDLDPSIVTRSSLLGGGDFTPGDVEFDTLTKINAFADYFTNSNGAIKAFAYSVAGGSTYHYGVADGDTFANSDYDYAVVMDGDENVYEVATDVTKDVEGTTVKAYPTNHDLMIYTQSGDKLTVKKMYVEKTGLADEAKLVKGYTDGLIVLESGATAYKFTDTNKKPLEGSEVAIDSVMTDSETVVYVMNSSTGYYELGDLDSIAKDSYVKVVLVDKDGYADLVLVDEYTVHAND